MFQNSSEKIFVINIKIKIYTHMRVSHILILILMTNKKMNQFSRLGKKRISFEYCCMLRINYNVYKIFFSKAERV